MRAIPTEAPRDGLAGAADLAFQMNLNNSTQHAGLLVGMVLERKSWKDTHVIEQLYHYYFEVIRQKIAPNVPTVAIILYNGKEDWDPMDFRLYPDYPDYFKGIGVPFKLEFIDVGEHIDFSDLEDYDPQALLTLVALCYAQDSEHYKELFQKVLELMKTMEYSEVIDTINAILIYLKSAFSVGLFACRRRACKTMTEPLAELSEGQLESMRAFSEHWILHTFGVQNDSLGRSPS